MTVIPIIGHLLLIIALMLLGADVVATLEAGGGGFQTRSTDELVVLLSGGSPTMWIESTLPPSVATYLVVALDLPAWLPLGIIGVLLALIPGRRRAPAV